MPPSVLATRPGHDDDHGPRSCHNRPEKHRHRDGGDQEEIALGDLLPSLLLRADDSADLVLVGIDADDGDGGSECGREERMIRAHRCILAARSAVFERMLYGPFAEAGHGTSSDAGVVRIGFEHGVLRAVVEYCYTDRAGLFDVLGDGGSWDREKFENWARSMVRLCAAADYFRLPGLASRIVDMLREEMTDDDDVGPGGPALACAVLDEAECHGGGDGGGCDCGTAVITGIGGVHDAAMRVIRSNAREALLPAPGCGSGVEACGPAAMETILSDGGVMADELSMFRALHRWAFADDAEVDDLDGRREIAARLCSEHIRLTRIQSEDLRTVVAPSGLVRPDLLDVALRDRTVLEGVFFGIVTG